MGCDIHGWVEVDFFGTFKGLGTAWYPHIDIRMLLERNYTMFARLFDVRNDGNVKALFPKRGLPPVEKYHEKDWRDMNYKDWNGDAHSASYVYWSELEPHLDELIPIASQGWITVFNMMKELAKFRGSKNVRMVVWFDN